MKNWIAGAVMIAGLATVGTILLAAPPAAMAPLAPAQETPDQRFHRKMDQAFQGFKVEETSVKDVNGIKVHYLRIIGGGGATAGAAVTEQGDYLLAGVPHDPNRMPGEVQKLVSRWFAGPPAALNQYSVTTYNIDLDVNGFHDTVVMDAVGRLLSVRPDYQSTFQQEVLARDDVYGKDAETTKRMDSLAERFWGKGSKVDHIYADPTHDHWFHIHLVAADSRQYDVVTNSNDVYARSEKLKMEEVPAGVMNMARDLFKGAKITNVQRREYEYWQFNETLAGGDTIELHVGTNGDVLEISSALSKQDQAAINAENKRP